MARFLVLLAVGVFVGSQAADTCSKPQPQPFGLCPTDPIVFVKMGDICCDPKDVVTPGVCVDKMNPKTPGVSDCPRMASYCRNSDYLELMKDQCPKTCGYCTAPGGSTCVDKINEKTGQSDCPQMAAYCRNSLYLDLMRDQCPKTCAYCT